MLFTAFLELALGRWMAQCVRVLVVQVWGPEFKSVGLMSEAHSGQKSHNILQSYGPKMLCLTGYHPSCRFKGRPYHQSLKKRMMKQDMTHPSLAYVPTQWLMWTQTHTPQNAHFHIFHFNAYKIYNYILKYFEKSKTKKHGIVPIN